MSEQDTQRGTDHAITKWLERKRGRAQFRPAPSAGMAVGKVMRPLSKKYGSGSSALALARVWPDIMGPRWSKISTPVRFIGGNDGRSLVISAPGPSAAFIMAASRQIIDRLNAHLGDGYVMRLKIVQRKMTDMPAHQPKKGLSPRQADSLENGLSDIAPSPLRDALEKLGRGVIQDDTS